MYSLHVLPCNTTHNLINVYNQTQTWNTLESKSFMDFKFPMQLKHIVLPVKAESNIITKA